MIDSLELERLGHGDRTGLLTIAETAATLRASQATVYVPVAVTASTRRLARWDE
jgi:hypothetical protein